MIPGEVITLPGALTLNAGRETVTLEVANGGDRPIQVGSHYHFAETNPALVFDRPAARVWRPPPSSTAGSPSSRRATHCRSSRPSP